MNTGYGGMNPQLQQLLAQFVQQQTAGPGATGNLGFPGASLPVIQPQPVLPPQQAAPQQSPAQGLFGGSQGDIGSALFQYGLRGLL